MLNRIQIQTVLRALQVAQSLLEKSPIPEKLGTQHALFEGIVKGQVGGLNAPYPKNKFAV